MRKIGLFLLFIGFVMVSCSSDDSSESGKVEVKLKYEDFVDKKMNQVLTEEFGMDIYPGDTPPVIEGSFVASPFFCKKSNFPDFSEGLNFGSTDLTFFNQNNLVQSIDFNSLLTYNPGFNGKLERWDGKGCFISGAANKFSVVFHTEGSLEVGNGVSAWYKNLVAVSGELVVDELGKVKGIANFQLASVMLDDFGDPHGILVAVGMGRLWTDDYAERK
ncbi:hypothetical protein [Flavobacterium sp. NKUCC04_CG]|uniref:hypothetical protein n=1 Tax=Flavobacterium sp. NKUCC04_CG TaxID=2842121 RepID=UPI001C5AA33C|nr:hypothetical protein [Flavobacterium sp. NKUCC04_CG]MBW3519903.1 hypothetical protein [Flavobacterium sp. NKUCC04_CG]